MKNATCLVLLFLAACQPDHTVVVDSAGPVDPTGGSTVTATQPVRVGHANPVAESPNGAAVDPANSDRMVQADTSPDPAPSELTGELRFATNEADLNLPRNAFASAEMLNFWVRVHADEMPDLALLHVTFFDPNGVPFARESAWFAVRSGIPAGAGQIVYLASHDGSGFDLDVEPMLFTARLPMSGEWMIQATLDGYNGSIEGTITIR